MGRAGLFAMLATVGLAWAVRSLGADQVFAGGDVVFPVGDTYYHLRRALVGMSIFPAVLVWDPLLNFPDGGFVPWPPLHDWLLSGLGLLAGGTRPALERVAAWLPPALGALTVIPVYLAAARFGGWRLGATAGLVFALLPVSVLASRVGYADHHCTLAAAGAVWLAAALVSIDTGRRGAELLLVGARIAVLLTWSGSLLYVAIADGAFLAVEAGEGRPRRLARFGAGLAASALIVAAAVPALGWQGGGPYSALGLSWLHPLGLGALASTAWIVAAWQWRRPASGPRAVLRVAAVGAGLGAALLLLPELRATVLEAAGFVGKREPWAARNAEQLPLWGPAGAGSWTTPLGFFGPLGYAIPLLPLAAWWRGRHQPQQRAPGRLLALWIAGFGTLALLQVRYGSDFAAPAAVGAALLGEQAVRAVAHRASRRAARAVAAALALLFLGPLLVAPLWAWSQSGLAGRDPALASPAGSLYRFAESVRELTPPTVSFSDPSQRADYAVLCPPNLGHVLHYVSERATPADNFGPYAGSRWFEDVRRFYAIPAEAPAFSFARQTGARYVVTMDFGGAPPDTLQHRLHVDDGRAVGAAPAWNRFRLVHEGPRGGVPLTALFSTVPPRPGGPAPYKLYEVVDGAVLEAQALPGTPIRAEVTVRTSTGRRFEYRVEGAANVHGRARVRVPYPTDGAAPTRTVGRYRVRVGDRSLELDVPEAAVRGGARLPVSG